MSVFAQLNIATGEWSVEANIESDIFDVLIGFKGEEQRIVFDNLSFGFTLNGQEYSYPPLGTNYVASDQDYLVAQQVSVEQGTGASFFVWASNANQDYETEVEITIPERQDNLDNNQATKPMPDGFGWQWDTERQEWIEPD
jgi:hypothetical protein